MIEAVDFQDAVRGALRQVDAPIFVGRLTQGSHPTLELGTLERGATKAIRERVAARLADCGIALRVVVRQHNAHRLAKVRSLQALIAGTGTGELVFDQTKALRRAESVLALSSGLRASLGASMAGAFFDAERRTFYVLLRDDARGRIADAEGRRAMVDAVEQAWRSGADKAGFDLSLCIGFELPAGVDVIAVDRATARHVLLVMLRRPFSWRLGAAVVGMLVGATVSLPALAADLVMSAPSDPMSAIGPAVDEPNFSISLLSGSARDPVLFDHLWAGLEAKATIPLGERFGAQVDLGAATDQYYGAALHLFARDPSMGLVGLVGSAESQYGVTMNRIGAEVEYYLNDKFTVSARVGYQNGTAPNGAFGRLNVKFYPDPNLALTAGGELQPTFALGRAGVEWRPAIDGLAGLSVSADASVTSTGDYRAMFGLHFQIGGSPTLLDRDRRSDPESGIYNKIDVSSAVPKGYVGPGPT